MTAIPVADERALHAAFGCWLGTTAHCQHLARQAHEWVKAGLHTDFHTGRRAIDALAWREAMARIAAIPKGGRWVWQAWKDFGYSIGRATGESR